MGRRSLIMLLRQAGLAHYVDNSPPLDDTPSITVAEYSSLLADVYDIFGARGAQPILQRGGRQGAAELRRLRPARFALTGTALRFLSSGRRLQRVLESLVDEGTEMYGAVYRLAESADAYYLEIADCPYCAEIALRSQKLHKPVIKPVCYSPRAIIDEMTEWGTGEKHLVEEVACVAQGAPACRFRVGK